MENKEFNKLLDKRKRKFAISIILFSAFLPKTPEYKVLKSQIAKTATSVGSISRLANRARSKADFRNKFKLCKGETIYWIEFKNAFLIHKEANELIAIFSTISRNTQL